MKCSFVYSSLDGRLCIYLMGLVGTFFAGIRLVGRACGDDEGSVYQSSGGEEGGCCTGEFAVVLGDHRV